MAYLAGERHMVIYLQQRVAELEDENRRLWAKVERAEAMGVRSRRTLPTREDAQVVRLKDGFERRGIHLTGGQACLLWLLYQYRGSAVPTRACQDVIHIHASEGDNAHRDNARGKPYGTVNVYALRLRRHLGADAIRTVWGVGYALTVLGVSLVDRALVTPERAAA